MKKWILTSWGAGPGRLFAATWERPGESVVLFYGTSKALTVEWKRRGVLHRENGPALAQISGVAAGRR